MSAYIGTPTRTARITPNGLLLPRTACIQLSGIQLWMTAPIPTPIKMYGNTFLNVSATCSLAYTSRSFTVKSSDSISTLLALRINSSTWFSMCIFSMIVPPTTAITKPMTTYTIAIFAPNMLISNTRLPRSTIGEEIKKENVTPSGRPALVNPMNSGIDEQEQNGVTVPSRAAIILAPIP